MRSLIRSSQTLSRRRQHAALVAIALVASITAAGCGGSALEPGDVLAANRAVQGVGVAAGGSAPVGAGDPGDVSGEVPATNALGATGTGDTGAQSGTNSGDSGSGSGQGTVSGPPAGSGVKAGSCAGFKNGPGITDTVIKVGNSSDVSGPIPGLFTSAQQATKAYVAYFNATSDICGRKLEFVTYDSKTDNGGDQASYVKMCDSVFASIGSMSAFDSGGAATAEECGLPDIRTAAATLDRNKCATCFGAQSTSADEFTNAIPDFFVKNYRAASQKAAFLYINAGAAAENAKTQQNVEEQRGMKFLYTSGIDVAEFNYAPYVQQMKSKGVRWVQFIGAYQQSVRLSLAMQQAGFKPDVRFFDPTVYDAGFVRSGGSAVEGTITFTNFTPLEESQPELNLYKQWLQQVSPGAAPTFFGEYAWSSAKLFVTQSIALGGKLNRATLVNAVKAQRAWTAAGLHSPMDVGGKHAPSCARFLQLKNGTWMPLKGTKYVCNGYTRAR